jgi:integrin alpha FG-GAP repeat containing protein 1
LAPQGIRCGQIWDEFFVCRDCGSRWLTCNHLVLTQSEHYTTFSGVIPNSQLIIIPYQPKDVDNPSTWTLELYIHPGDWIPWVLLALVSATLILALVVFALNWAEKREDEMEKKRALHGINFDAL